ncbi:MAG: hypothetical protein LBS55_06095 [Prevotellaceae bacterium]|jgi:hypothetical protein|nr:hypothetical protein [Prevotellaceae bacterium]
MGIFKQILAIAANDDDNILVFIKKHYKYIILIFILIILYISNGLIYDLEIRQQRKLEENLLKARVKYNTKLIEFREFGNYSNIINLSKKYNLGLEEPEKPPMKVEK